MATSSLGTKAGLSAGKAAEVSPTAASALVDCEMGGRGTRGSPGVRALVLLKELMVPGPLGCAQPPGSRMVTVKTQVGLTSSRRQRRLKG